MQPASLFCGLSIPASFLFVNPFFYFLNPVYLADALSILLPCTQATMKGGVIMQNRENNRGNQNQQTRENSQSQRENRNEDQKENRK